VGYLQWAWRRLFFVVMQRVITLMAVVTMAETGKAMANMLTTQNLRSTGKENTHDPFHHQHYHGLNPSNCPWEVRR